MARMRNVGVGRGRHVTGLIRDDTIGLGKEEAICADPAEFEGFVGSAYWLVM
jgi:hypothetical protein